MPNIKGKWVFNETIPILDPSASGVYQRVSFTSKGNEYAEINYMYDYDHADSTVIWYDGSIAWTESGWIFDAYRTVDFGTTEQTVSDTFYNWLTANAVPEQTEPTITPTTITYNGTELASLEEGQTATFPQGVKAKTDVSIAFGSKGSITYKGVTTEIEKGKTANLLCAGKKFATDVVVAVEKGATASTLTLKNTGNFAMYYCVDERNFTGENALHSGKSVEITDINSYVYCWPGVSFTQSKCEFTDCDVVWEGDEYAGCHIYPTGANATANIYSYD